MKPYAAAVIVVALAAAPAAAAPPEPSGAHPRLFLDDATVAALQAAAAVPDSAVDRAIDRCTAIHAQPGNYDSGGYQGLDFANNLGACAIAWVATGDDTHATEAVRFFRALLDDYLTIGDGAGGDDVVRHDTGYAMRAFAPYAAIGYDWLRGAPGVDDALLAHARARFKAWTDWYDADGYHNDQPGANYHAGYLLGATLISIAQGSEAGAEGTELWTHVVDDLFAVDMAAALTGGGALDGGDWIEGWQYGNLSVLSYAAAARALREQGVELAGYAAWEGQLIARAIHGAPPGGGQTFLGGDADVEGPYGQLSPMALYAAMIDVGPDDARGWAQHLFEDNQLEERSFLLLAALAEARAAPAVPFPADAPTWYAPAGSHTLYARSGWGDDDVWFVTRCLPGNAISDHLFFDAGNLVLSRGGDHLIVDPSPYGSMSSLSGNAPTISSATLPDGYQPGQGPWGTSDRVGFAWRRQTQSGAVVSRCEYAGQYDFREEAADVTRAVRDLVMIPTAAGKDATLIAIDYAAGGDGPLQLRYRTLETLTAAGDAATATIGGSRLRIQLASAGAAGTVRALPVGDCFAGQTRGNCDAARFDGGEWRTSIAGPTARAITVVDGADADPTPAIVTAGPTGFEVVGAERSNRWIAVVSATTPSGASSSAPLTYQTRGGLVATHVVVDAPRGDAGRSDVTARAVGDDCEVTVTSRSGDGGFQGRPLVLAVSASCEVAEDPEQDVFEPPTGEDPPPDDGDGDGDGDGDILGGCCDAGSSPASPLALGGLVALLIGRRRRKQ